MPLYPLKFLPVCWRLPFIRQVLAGLILLLASSGPAVMASDNSAVPARPDVALYYGDRPPLSQLRFFDWVVLQDSRLSTEQIDVVAATGAVPLAYLSVGEVARSADYVQRMAASWTLGENTTWQSLILDVRQPAVADFIVDDLAASMWSKGFRGFFLDTLDSYQLSAEGKQVPQAFANGLVHIIERLRKRWPEAIIILNRGFELLPAVRDTIDMVAFESLYHSIKATTGAAPAYGPVSEADRSWLLGKAAEVRAAGLPVLAIDYAAPDDPALRARIARQIESHDIIPWISDRDLSGFGRGRFTTVSRRILAVHDGQDQGIVNSSAHRYAALPLEYLGYWLDYVHINDNALTTIDTAGTYTGILVWLDNDTRNAGKLCRWLLQQQRRSGLPVVFMERMPTDPACYGTAGVESFDGDVAALEPVSIAKDDNGRPLASLGEYEGRLGAQQIERAVVLRQPETRQAKHLPQATPWVTYATRSGEIAHLVATTTTGGYALAPFVFERGLEDDRFWMLDPFVWFARAFRLRPLPAPDVTTENGRRILTAHIDGDGFASVAEIPGTPLAGEAIRSAVLEKYPFPHTVSVIEAEVSPGGVYPKSAAAAEAIARKIFRLPNVEIASHTHSHPFFWGVLEGNTTIEAKDYGFSLDIPGYQLDISREIEGSVNYIDNRLAPKGKRVEVFLWSGDAKPGPKALRALAKLGLLNVNGGDTKVVDGEASLTQVWPIGRPVDNFRQIYAPVMNENRYTNLWKGPYYGFRRVVETFKLLDSPRRLKPLSIYYHFYSGSKQASLEALHQVYDWSVAQSVVPMFLSDYARRANAFYDTSFALLDDDSWLIRHDGNLKTLRLPAGLPIPDLAGSSGIMGMKAGIDGTYVHLSGKTSTLRFRAADSPRYSQPYLLSANAIVSEWQVYPLPNDTFQVLITAQAGLGNLELEIANATSCKSGSVQKKLSLQQDEGTEESLRLRFDSAKVTQAILECR